MKNEISLTIFGILYKDQIEQFKFINTKLNNNFNKFRNTISCTEKICLSYLTHISNSYYCKNNNNYITFNSSQLSDRSNNYFSAYSLRRYINKMSNIWINENETILDKDENGIKINKGKNKKFTCILRFNNLPEELKKEFEKPSLILTLSFLLDKCAYHFVKNNSLIISDYEIEQIRKTINVTNKTLNNDLKVLIKNNLLNKSESGIVISQELFKKYISIININITKKKENNIIKQKELIIKAKNEKVIYDANKVSEITTNIIKEKTKNAISLIINIINSAEYNLEKCIGKNQANLIYKDYKERLRGSINLLEINQHGSGNFSTSNDSLWEINQHPYI